MPPNFDQLRETLLGKYAGRIPLAEIDVAVEIQEAFLGRPIRSPADTVDFWSQAGYDYVLFPIEIDFAGGTFPRSRSATSPPPRIKSLEEARRRRWPDPARFDPAELDALGGCLPPGMKIIPKLGGLFYFPSILLGFEDLCVAMLSDAPFAEYVFAKVGEIVTGLVSLLAGHPAVGAIWLSSDIAFNTSLMASPDALRKYVFRWVAQVAEISHGANLPLIYHSDGNLTEVIPDLLAAGIDALHPIEPLAMDVTAVRRQYGPRLCLIGNVDVGSLLISGTPEAVRNEAARLKSFFGDGGGYVLGSGNSIPADVPLENFRALIDATD